MPYHYSKTQHTLRNVFDRIERAIYRPLMALQVEAWITPEPVTFAARQSGAYKSLELGQSWGKLWDCAWFHFTGMVPKDATGQQVVLLIDVSGEACVVDEQGCPVLGLTTVSSTFDMSLGRPGKRVVPLTQQARGGEQVDVWADAGCNDLFGVYQDSGMLKEAHIALCHEEMYQLYHDFFVLHELMTQLPAEKAQHQRILAALSDAAGELSAYTEQEAQRARTMLAGELAKTGGSPSLQISAIGHAHIDLGWLWPIRETIRKGARSFATVLAMMEHYPDYIFGASQPQLYQWMKDGYPALYAKIREKVAEGRWEAQGAMWVEPDTNISGGEALVRQIMYGKRFFRAEFGKDPKMLWLPDVFGYTAALPQLLQKAGIEYFLTIKLSWNTFNVFPHHTFFWQGLDGSRVLVHMPPEGTYNSSAAPRAIVAAEHNFADSVVSEHCALIFGIGDGGGGPGTEHLERLAREKNLAGLAPVLQEPMERFFQRIAQESTEYKVWEGELYLEKHQGTYTTQARNKRFNRKIELALRDLEFVASMAHATGQYSYPREALDAIWREVLLYQFHDILPGSSITRVYEESLARYQTLFDQVQHLLHEAQVILVQKGKAEGPVTVFNTLSWERSAWLRIQDQWCYVTVPAMGYKEYTPALQHTDVLHAPSLDALAASSDELANELLQVRFAADGTIASIFDKEYQGEVLARDMPANRLAVYRDEGDAWDFPIDYDERSSAYFQLETASARLDGPQAIVEHHYRFGDSTLQQRIVLTAGSRRIDFVTTVDWRERHKMLRTSFPVAVQTSEVTCDIQFGSIKRPTHRNTVWEMAKYEICAHKWLDLSQWEYGVALLNDCKYGHKVSENTLDLNLLRSPTYPDPQADRALHEFTYALYPHAGNHISGRVIQAGYELNVPLHWLEGEAQGRHAGAPFVQVSAENVIIETVKQAEESGDLVVRLYEAWGANTSTRLTFEADIAAIWQTNLLEEPQKQLAHHQERVELQLKPFEILTVRVQLFPLDEG